MTSVVVRDTGVRLSAERFGDPTLMRELALVLRTRILRRTAAGRDYAGDRFTPYNEGYAKQRAKVGLGKRVDLMVSGEMLRAITISDVTATSVTLTFSR